jgi:glycosyltransferase involved in cell wall biosynthesis
MPSREETSAAVLSLLKQDEERIEMGERARKIVLERYSAEAMAQAYERVYDELLG